MATAEFSRLAILAVAAAAACGIGVQKAHAQATTGATPSSAHSPEPGRIALHLAAGLSSMRRVDESEDSDTSSGSELHFDVGLLINCHVAVGGHFGLTFGHSREDFYHDGSGVDYRRDYGTMEAGAAVLLFAGEHVWFTPWIGVVSLEENELGGGLTAGFDFLRSRKGHRLGAYLQAFQTANFEKEDEVSIRGVQLGLAYGFR